MTDIFDIGFHAHQDWPSAFSHYESDSASATLLEDDEFEMSNHSPFQQSHSMYSLNAPGQVQSQHYGHPSAIPIERYMQQNHGSDPFVPTGSIDPSGSHHYQQQYCSPSHHTQQQTRHHFEYNSEASNSGGIPQPWPSSDSHSVPSTPHHFMPPSQGGQHHYQSGYLANNSNSSSQHQASRISSPSTSTVLSSASGSGHYAPYQHVPGDQTYLYHPGSTYANASGAGTSHTLGGVSSGVAPREISHFAGPSTSTGENASSNSGAAMYGPRAPSNGGDEDNEDAIMGNADDENLGEQHDEQHDESAASTSHDNEDDEEDPTEDGADSDFKPSKRQSRGAHSPNSARRKKQRAARHSSGAGSASSRKYKVVRPSQSGRGGTTGGQVTTHRHSSGASQHLSNISGPANPNASNTEANRPFLCPLAPYGCSGTFTSKNEWKRHIHSQHLPTGFWRCDMCPERARPNDFNRKDLFTQHLRRMHASLPLTPHSQQSQSQPQTPRTPTSPSARRQSAAAQRRRSSGAASAANASTAATGAPSGPDNEEFENALEEVRQRCWIQLRDTPQHLSCVFCNHSGRSGQPQSPNQNPTEVLFRGPTGTEEWLEHVGKHLAATSTKMRRCIPKAPRTDAEETSSPIKEPGDLSVEGDLTQWFARDLVLRDWLQHESLLDQDGRGLLKIAEANRARERAMETGSGSWASRGGTRGGFRGGAGYRSVKEEARGED